MTQQAAQLIFLRRSLFNAYDRKDWETVAEMSRLIDALANERARRSIHPDEDAV